MSHTHRRSSRLSASHWRKKNLQWCFFCMALLNSLLFYLCRWFPTWVSGTCRGPCMFFKGSSLQLSVLTWVFWLPGTTTRVMSATRRELHFGTGSTCSAMSYIRVPKGASSHQSSVIMYYFFLSFWLHLFCSQNIHKYSQLVQMLYISALQKFKITVLQSFL